ncbi:hypothetical protein ACOMHN_015666 [Nucella lapillus]
MPPERHMARRSAGGQSGSEGGLEINDTEWPLEKTLPVPRGYTTIGSRRKEEEMLDSPRGDPELKRSVTMVYTSKPVVIKSPDPRSSNGLGQLEDKRDDRPPVPEQPTRSNTDNRYGALLKARAKEPPAKKSEFDHVLQCPQCKRRMVEPKVVCCRRICQSCLQGEIDSTARKGVFWCKMCGSTILIPDPKQPQRTWARQFDTDTFLANLREAVVQLEGKRLCFVCSSRNVTMDACNYCFDCATYFCNACTENHRHMPNQRNHRVKKLDEITATELMKQKKRFCRTHEGVTLDFYCIEHKTVMCQEHKTAMCQECAVSVHQNCGSITTVAKLAAEKKETQDR